MEDSTEYYNMLPSEEDRVYSNIAKYGCIPTAYFIFNDQGVEKKLTLQLMGASVVGGFYKPTKLPLNYNDATCAISLTLPQEAASQLQDQRLKNCTSLVLIIDRNVGITTNRMLTESTFEDIEVVSFEMADWVNDAPELITITFHGTLKGYKVYTEDEEQEDDAWEDLEPDNS